MIFHTFLLKQIISTYSLIKKRMGGNGPTHGTQWSGPWYSMVRPMSHKRTTYEPPPTPPKGERDKEGITIAIRYTYNCCERVL